jgi:hypothetical protein
MINSWISSGKLKRKPKFAARKLRNHKLVIKILNRIDKKSTEK